MSRRPERRFFGEGRGGAAKTNLRLRESIGLKRHLYRVSRFAMLAGLFSCLVARNLAAVADINYYT